MADFDIGYYYYLHDKIEDEKENKADGNSMIGLGIFLAIMSASLFMLFRRQEFFILTVLGSIFSGYGFYKHSSYVKLPHPEPHHFKDINVEVHHDDRPNILARPSILRHKLTSSFSEELSTNLNERTIITSVIKQNSGSDINSIYGIYRLQGGLYDPEHFVKTLHSLKKHGVVRVMKTRSQASRIPASSM